MTTPTTTPAGRRREAQDRRLIAAGHAEHAETGRPPTLRGLARLTGLHPASVTPRRRRLARESRWPWPIPARGDQSPRDERGLAVRQAYWLAEFRRHSPISLAAVARAHGMSESYMGNLYRLLRRRGHPVPPLARPVDRRGHDRRDDPSPEEIAAMARRIRAERGPPPPGP